MAEAARAQKTQPDQPLLDTTPYGSGKDDSVTDATEAAAITHHTVTIDGTKIPYTATGRHLVTVDLTARSRLRRFLRLVHRRTSPNAQAARSPSSTTAGRDRRRSSSCSARSRRGGSRPHARFHAARSLRDGGQPGQPARPQRPRVHQSGRHRLFGGDRAGHEQGLLGRRPGRALHQAVHQALPDQVQPLELAEIPVRRVVRHAPAAACWPICCTRTAST